MDKADFLWFIVKTNDTTDKLSDVEQRILSAVNALVEFPPLFYRAPAKHF